MRKRRPGNRDKFEPLLREAMKDGPLTAKQIAEVIGTKPGASLIHWGPDAVTKVRASGLKLIVVGKLPATSQGLYLLEDMAASHNGQLGPMK